MQAPTFLCQPKDKFEIDLGNNPADEDIVDFEWITQDELDKFEKEMESSLVKLIKGVDL